jgi:hypothetical protein
MIPQKLISNSVNGRKSAFVQKRMETSRETPTVQNDSQAGGVGIAETVSGSRDKI